MKDKLLIIAGGWGGGGMCACDDTERYRASEARAKNPTGKG